MANDLPAPLSPPDCDLRGYDFMPLFGHRLFNSSFNDKASDAEFRTAMRLWWAAWQQCPAGSLPDDDAALARLADFGRDLKSWRKVREVALHGFQQCNDGRLYHPMLCQQAQEAYERRKRERERKAKMREAKRNPETEKPNDNSDANGSVPRDSLGTGNGHDAGRPAGQHVGQAQEVPVSVRSDRTGQDRTGQERVKLAVVSSTFPRVSPEPDKPQIAPARMPTLNDPPARWMVFADKRETDNDGVERPVVGGYYFDGVARDVCLAAGIDGYGRPLDWAALARLLRDGFDPEEHILPAIRRVAARPGYKAPRLLSYFDRAVREGRAA